MSELLKLGVNRVSMGVQSLDDGILRWMRRRHDSATARRAFGILRDAGVENVSLDLIFGLPQLTRETLSDTLDGICGLRPEHVSAYQLSVEEGSDLAAMAADGRFTEASEELCAGQYEMICSRLQAAGYVHYEISNWALPGREAKHNSAYWERVPYVGFGPGAHSFDGERRSWNSCELSGWSGSGELLTEAEAREERIMLGLRTARGIPATSRSAHRPRHPGDLVPSGGPAPLPRRRLACRRCGYVDAGRCCLRRVCRSLPEPPPRPRPHPRIPLVRFGRHRLRVDMILPIFTKTCIFAGIRRISINLKVCILEDPPDFHKDVYLCRY